MDKNQKKRLKPETKHVFCHHMTRLMRMHLAAWFVHICKNRDCLNIKNKTQGTYA